ncbi:hypothetical protein V5799_019292, partial [Amblyomma americanum]
RACARTTGEGADEAKRSHGRLSSARAAHLHAASLLARRLCGFALDLAFEAEVVRFLTTASTQFVKRRGRCVACRLFWRSSWHCCCFGKWQGDRARREQQPPL